MVPPNPATVPKLEFGTVENAGVSRGGGRGVDGLTGSILMCSKHRKIGTEIGDAVTPTTSVFSIMGTRMDSWTGTPNDGIRLEGSEGHMWGPHDSENRCFRTYRIAEF